MNTKALFKILSIDDERAISMGDFSFGLSFWHPAKVTLQDVMHGTSLRMGFNGEGDKGLHFFDMAFLSLVASRYLGKSSIPRCEISAVSLKR